ncbi:MAG: hypothetical protein OXU81_08635 [Gammaproteobacteria bacterium]|nr:hypothetical protein [Gammaproteobacteria bacterium]
MEARRGGERRLARYGLRGGVARGITKAAGGELIQEEERRKKEIDRGASGAKAQLSQRNTGVVTESA